MHHRFSKAQAERRPALGRRSVATTLAMICICIGRLTTAQSSNSNFNSQVQTGFPKDGTFDGDNVVSVNLANLNLHIEIPVYNMQGRGVGSSYHFILDSTTPWVTDSDGYPYAPVPVLTLQSNIPLIEDDTVVVQTAGPDCSEDNCISVFADVHTFYVIDGNNTRHMMVPTNQFVPGEWYGGTSATFHSIDDGYVMTIVPTGQPNNANAKTLYDKHGTAYGPIAVETDTNGNQVVTTNTIVVDTLGRKLAADASYVDPSGNVHAPQITNIVMEIPYLDGNDQPLTYPLTLPVSIQMADGATYTLTYQSPSDPLPGYIKTLTVPSGAIYAFEFDAVCPGLNTMGLSKKTLTLPSLSGGSPGVSIWNYACDSSGGGLVTVTDPFGNDTTQLNPIVKYPYSPPPAQTQSVLTHYAGSGSERTLLDTATTTYRNLTGECGYATLTQPISVVTTLASGQTKETDTDYENFYVKGGCVGPPNDQLVNDTISYGNVTSSTEYDYGPSTQGSQATHGAALRITNTQYLHNDPNNLFAYYYVETNIVDRPVSVQVLWPGGSSLDQYQYDQYRGTTSMISGTAVNHDPTYDTNHLYRGNVTSHIRQVSSGVFDTSYMQYDTLGNLRSITDPRGIVTSIDYTDNFVGASCLTGSVGTFAFPTAITTGGETERKSYYSCTGQVANDKSPNDVANGFPGTSVTYDGGLRTTEITMSGGGDVRYSYNDVSPNPSVTVTTAASPDPSILQTTYFDGLHRAVGTSVAGGATTQTVYDANSRVVKKYYPYMTGQLGGFTGYTYDATGRVLSQTEAGTQVASYTYNGTATTLTDERGLSHKQIADGLGRMTDVFEADSNGSPTLHTHYGYDGLGNLLSVSQTGDPAYPTTSVNRTFTYDGESRLLTASNPESGVICYGQWSGGGCVGGYDGDGNLLFKTDANNHVTSYTYDPQHNRLIQKKFIEPVPSSPFGFIWESACFTYGGNVPNSVGKLTSEWTQPGVVCTPGTGTPTALTPTSSHQTERDILAYSPTQAVLSEQQCTQGYCTPGQGVSNSLKYTYDLVGKLNSYTNGAAADGYSFVQVYDAVGRLSTMTEQISSNALFTANAYTPAGAIQSMWLGPNIKVNRTYDVRQRISGEIATAPNPAP